MKILASSPYRTALTAALSSLWLCSTWAVETNGAPQTISSSQVVTPDAAAPAAAPKLPYGVDDVLKLSRAQVGDDIVVKYIQNSGTIYSLGPQEIVYLRNQGVSDRVLTAMLDQRKLAAEAAAPSMAAPSIANAPTVPNASMVPPAPDYAQVAPQAVAPAPESSVYVIPSAPTTYYSYPYYAPYYGYSYPYYWGPTIAFGFGYGGHYGGYYHGGYYHGGYHGGYGYGGGYHGGGHGGGYHH